MQDIAGVTLVSCGDCGGCFMDDDAVLALLADDTDARANAVLGALAANARPTAAAPKGVRNCPACATAMTRALSPEGAGVVIDVCKPHGVFLDAGELRRMLDFARREARERTELTRRSPLSIQHGNATRQMYPPEPRPLPDPFTLVAWFIRQLRE